MKKYSKGDFSFHRLYKIELRNLYVVLNELKLWSIFDIKIQDPKYYSFIYEDVCGVLFDYKTNDEEEYYTLKKIHNILHHPLIIMDAHNSNTFSSCMRTMLHIHKYGWENYVKSYLPRKIIRS
jgi:hypothetical protein